MSISQRALWNILQPHRHTNLSITKCFHSCRKRIFHGSRARLFSETLDRCLPVAASGNFNTSAFLYKTHDKKPVVFKKVKAKSLAKLYKNMTVGELATALNKSLDQVFESMIYIDGADEFYDEKSRIYKIKVIQDIAKFFKIRYVLVAEETPEEQTKYDVKRRPPPDEGSLVPRAPVVTIMGHVDHGKTTLLDYLRNSSIVEGEFGGITQHIGAFEVSLRSGGKVTFLDTPGHAAFSAMRARGANMTDIIVLVVAAEDGVMPQTKEVIDLSQEADIPMIVAINKIDAPNANIKKTKESLLEAGVQLESQGGDIQSVEISALKGINIDALIEALLAQAEVLNLKGDPKGLVEGYIIESRQDPVKGKVASCLVDRGTLQKGDIIVAGIAYGKVRSMTDEGGALVKQAGPSSAVQVLGFREIPEVGDEFLEVSSESLAKRIVDWRRSQLMQKKIQEDEALIAQERRKHTTVYEQERDARRAAGFRRKLRMAPKKRTVEETHPRFTVLLKGDVSGSVEAIMDILTTYDDDEQCILDVAGYGVGLPTETELNHLHAFKGTLYTFNLQLPSKFRQQALKLGVPIRQHNVIYHLVDELKKDISDAIPETLLDDVEGEGVVEEEFIVTIEKKKRPVAGCSVRKGLFKIGSLFKVIRDNELIYDGKLRSMKHMKNEVSSIQAGVQCGLQVEDSAVRFEKSDVILCYNKKPMKGLTKWQPEGFH